MMLNPVRDKMHSMFSLDMTLEGEDIVYIT